MMNTLFAVETVFPEGKGFPIILILSLEKKNSICTNPTTHLCFPGIWSKAKSCQLWIWLELWKKNAVERKGNSCCVRFFIAELPIIFLFQRKLSQNYWSLNIPWDLWSTGTEMFFLLIVLPAFHFFPIALLSCGPMIKQNKAIAQLFLFLFNNAPYIFCKDWHEAIGNTALLR